MEESNLNDVLFPKTKPASRRTYPSTRSKRRRRRGSHKSSHNLLLALVLLLIVLGVIFSMADIGGNIILGLAQRYITENLNLTLTAKGITGNPVKGYRLQDFSLATLSSASGDKLLDAESLSVHVNFPALLTGNIRLASVSIGGLSMDVDSLLATVQTLSFTGASAATTSFMASPAYADSSNAMPLIPVDRVSIIDSRISSTYGTLTINELTADLRTWDIHIDGKLNNTPINGVIDMGESAGLTAINRSDINVGSGKLIATGGLIEDKLDLHISLEELDLQDMTGLYPALLKSSDFAGTTDVNLDITGDTSTPRVIGTIDFTGSKIYGYPVERVSANVNYADYRLGFSNIQALMLNVPIQGEVAAAMRPGENLSVLVKLDGSGANLDDLDKILGVPELKDLTGRVETFSANISGPVDKLSGIVNLTASRIAYSGHALTNIRTQLKLTRSDTAQVDGKFQLEGAQGYIQGSVASLLTAPKMDVTAKIVDLDIKRVQNLVPDASDYKLGGKVTASVNVKGTTSNPTITGSLSSPEFSGWEQTITKPAVNFTFADKTLTLTKTEGTLNGMPINLTGKVWPLPSSNPNLNINATISTTPAALAAYVPDIEGYKLKGNINVGLKVTGSVNSPSMSLVASSPNLEAMDMFTAKDIELTTDLNGDLTTREGAFKLDNIRVNASAKSITSSGLTFTNVNTNLTKTGDRLTLGGLNAHSGTGTITGGGTADIAGKTPLDFNFTFTDLALASLMQGAGLGGNMSGTLKVSGTNTAPAFALNTKAEGAEVSASGTVNISPLKVDIAVKGNNIVLDRLLPDFKDSLSGRADLTFTLTGTDKNITGKGVLTSTGITAYGVKITNITLPLTYSGNTFASTGGSAKLSGGTVNNTLTLTLDTMKYTDTLDVSGTNIAQLINDVSPEMKDSLTGTGTLSLSITGTGAKVSAKGTLTIPNLTAWSLKLSSINLPLSYSGNSFASSGGTAKLYNGTLKNTLTFNVNKMTFTDNIDASGVDVNALIQDASGGLDGRITGTGKLSMKINGSVKDKVSYSGTGNFSMGAGAITGFKWLNLIAKVHNTRGINYTSINAPLALQTGRLILKTGSIANAPTNDPMYKYAKLTQDGIIDFSGQDIMLNLTTESSINYQLINAIQGGSVGGLEALFKGGTSSFKDGLRTFLEGGLAGAEKTASTGDFRVVNLKISGKATEPSFSGLKIGPSTLKPKTQTQSTDKKPATQTLKDKLIDRAVDAIAPGLKKPTTTTPQTSPSTQTQPAARPTGQNRPTGQQTQKTQQNTRQQVEDKVKEELKKGLQKGLGGLLKR